MNKFSKEQIELNKEYISLIIEMRELNKKRFEIFKKFEEITPKADIDIKVMRTTSIYRDLFGNNLN